MLQYEQFNAILDKLMPYPYSGEDLKREADIVSEETIVRDLQRLKSPLNTAFASLKTLAREGKITAKQLDQLLVNICSSPYTLTTNFLRTKAIRSGELSLLTVLNKNLSSKEYQNDEKSRVIVKSVHDPESTMDTATVVESKRCADILIQKYRLLDEKILHTTLEEIRKWAETAKINGISALDYINSNKPTLDNQKYKIQEILVMTWLAIHDPSLLASKDSDCIKRAEKVFSEGLFDIAGGKFGAQICQTGTLNKLIEVARTVMNPEIFSLAEIKQSSEIKEHYSPIQITNLTQTYVKKRAYEFLSTHKKYLKNLKKNDFMITPALWEEIREKVEKDISAKTGHSLENDVFDNAIQYITLDPKKLLPASRGWQAGVIGSLLGAGIGGVIGFFFLGVGAFPGAIIGAWAGSIGGIRFEKLWTESKQKKSYNFDSGMTSGLIFGGIFAAGFSFIPVLGTVLGAIVGFAIGSIVGVGLQAFYEKKYLIKEKVIADGIPKIPNITSQPIRTSEPTPISKMPNIHARLNIKKSSMSHADDNSLERTNVPSITSQPVRTSEPTPILSGTERRYSRGQ